MKMSRRDFMKGVGKFLGIAVLSPKLPLPNQEAPTQKTEEEAVAQLLHSKQGHPASSSAYPIRLSAVRYRPTRIQPGDNFASGTQVKFNGAWLADVTMADTETGEVEFFPVDKKGRRLPGPMKLKGLVELWYSHEWPLECKTVPMRTNLPGIYIRERRFTKYPGLARYA